MMKNKIKKSGALLMAGVLCLTAAGVCSYKEASASAEASDDGAGILDGIVHPSDLVLPVREAYVFPEMGLTVTLPESLLERMEQKEVAMLMGADVTEDGSAVKYAFLSWNALTQEQWDAEVDVLGDGYSAWEESLERIGTVGVYQAELADQLDDLTGCDEHQELGQTEDEAYRYYLSINTEADKELTAELKQVQAEITEMLSLEEIYGSDMPEEEFSGTSLGEFTMQDIQGETYTQEMFRDYDLTMVNVFTTWCSPCVAEIPELEELHQQMADQGVNVVGVVLDAINEKGEMDQEAIEKAKILAEKTGASYPFLIPDATYLNGRLVGIQAVPETFFVDQDGNIVGETYSGSNDLEGWTSVVEQELTNLKEGK